MVDITPALLSANMRIKYKFCRLSNYVNSLLTSSAVEGTYAIKRHLSEAMFKCTASPRLVLQSNHRHTSCYAHLLIGKSQK